MRKNNKIENHEHLARLPENGRWPRGDLNKGWPGSSLNGPIPFWLLILVILVVCQVVGVGFCLAQAESEDGDIYTDVEARIEYLQELTEMTMRKIHEARPDIGERDRLHRACKEALELFYEKEHEAFEAAPMIPAAIFEELDLTLDNDSRFAKEAERTVGLMPSVAPIAQARGGVWLDKLLLSNSEARLILGRSANNALIDELKNRNDEYARLKQSVGNPEGMLSHQAYPFPYPYPRRRLSNLLNDANSSPSLVIQSATPFDMDKAAAEIESRIHKGILSLTVSEDGRYLAANLSGVLVMYETESGLELWRTSTGGFVRNISFFKNVAMIQYDGEPFGITIEFYQVTSGKSLNSINTILGKYLFFYGQSPDRRYQVLTSLRQEHLVIVDMKDRTIAKELSPIYFYDEIFDQKEIDVSQAYEQANEQLTKLAFAKFETASRQLLEQYGIIRDSRFFSDPVEAANLNQTKPYLEKDDPDDVYINIPDNGRTIPAVINKDGLAHKLKKEELLSRDGLYVHGGLDDAWFFITDTAYQTHLFSLKEDKYFTTLRDGHLPNGSWMMWKVLLDEAPKRIIVDLVSLDLIRDNPIARVPHLVAEVDLENGQVTVMVEPGRSFSNRISAMAISAQQLLFCALVSGQGWLYDLNNGSVSELYQGLEATVTVASFSSNGQKLAIGTGDGRLLLFKGSEPPSTLANNLGEIKNIACDDAGDKLWILSKDEEGSFRLKYIELENKVRTVVSRKLDPHVEPLISYDQTNDRLSVLWPAAESTEPELWEEGKAEIIRHRPANQFKLDLPCEKKYLAWSAPDQQLAYECNVDETYGNQFVQSLADGALRLLRRDELFYNFSFSASHLLFHESNQLAATLEEQVYGGSGFSIYNLKTGSMLMRMEDQTKHVAGLKGGAFLSGSPVRLVTVGNDAVVRLWDLGAAPSPVNTLSLAFLANGNYVFMDGDGRFDSPDLDGLAGLHWTYSKYPGQALPLDSFIRDYYQPGLAKYILTGNQSLPAVPEVGTRDLFQHQVDIIEVKPEPGQDHRVAVTVAVGGQGEGGSKPARDLKLFRDGRLVAQHNGAEGRPFECTGSPFTFRNIALPRNKNQVLFTAHAFNIDKVRSKTASFDYQYSASPGVEPRLFVVAAGVNNFDDPAFDLKYAVNDARAFVEGLSDHFTSGPVKATALIGDRQTNEPTKNNLRSALMDLQLKGNDPKKFDGPGPDDVVALLISSHGLTLAETFYILPSDIPEDGPTHPDFPGRAVSADELGQWLAGIDAGEIVMVLDACQSGSALGGDDFKPGPMGDRGLGQLAYDKAMRILSATNENKPAMEYDNLEHGLLSHVLMVEGLERGLGQGADSFTVRDWFKFALIKTSEVETQAGGAKGFGRPPQGPDSVQEPRFFDFGGADSFLLRKRNAKKND